ncbi:MAG: trypsin-like peptidase domain-containing protein [Thermoflexus sp.]|jgi:2-alkenal reductase|nr:trypsin-like peptidase domain-containing protein [Thermoflexus sp.]
MRWKNGFWLLLGLSVLLSGCRSLPLRERIFVTPTPRPGGAVVRSVGPIPTPLPSTSGLDEEEQRLIAIYQKVLPSVVNIDVEGTEVSAFGSGSGFVYDTDGHIVTNNHVVMRAGEIWVTFYDGTVAPARVVGRDVYSDLAVVRVDVPRELLRPVELGDSETLRVGQKVVAIGNPFGLRGTMTLGIISALGRALQTPTRFQIPDVIQTDAPINPGNSGGPLVDLEGRVIGVNSAIRTDSDLGIPANIGIGFAVPVNAVKQVVPQLIREGRARYPYLGITAAGNVSLAELRARGYDVPDVRGVLIQEIQPDGPAARAGLRGGTREVRVRGVPVRLGGDIVTAIDGRPVASFDELVSHLVNRTEVGQTVTLTILRDGQERQIRVTLGERPSP